MVLDGTDPTAWCAALEQMSGAGIRVLARAPVETNDGLIEAFAVRAVPLGYVVLDAQLDVAEDARRAFWHRHVVLVHRGALTAVSARWIRELAHASPRAHGVLALAAQPDRARESSGLLMHALDPLPLQPTGALAQRAMRLRRRRRLAAAHRWTCAALESSRRSADEWGAAVAFAQLQELSKGSAAATLPALITRGRRLLQGLRLLAPRSHVVAALADVWLTLGELEAASAALAAVDVECTLAGVTVPPWIRAHQCELACWQGRWQDARRWARETAHPGWHAVAAFGQRDWATVRVLAPAAGESHGEWRALLALMSCGVSGDRPGVVHALDEVRRCESPPRWRDTLVLESLRLAGADEEATTWRLAVQDRARGPAEHALWQWVTRGGGAVHMPSLLARVREVGAEGIRRFGMGRHNMHVWAGVSSLLEQVHEADDPATALRRGCRWAREYTGLDLVGIVSHDGSAVLACDPDDRRQVLGSWKRAGDGTSAPEGTRVAPVRYGGVRIAEAVLRGHARDEAEAQAVAMALATACAPAVRARLDDLLVAGSGEALAGDLLGASPAMRGLRDAVARAAASTFPVLIEGESGTGKELVARAIHRLSPRRDRRWAAINCAALTDELLEAELFGHVRGAFTGAMGPRVGLLEDAHEGTLFLDEVAELSPRAQAKLLRVLQEGEIRRVGENVSRRVDVRLVTATNRPLSEAARQGAYREDLVFRLAVIRLRVPPLRERIEDVPVLAQSFWRAAAARVSTGALLAPDAIAALCRYHWPGNVRELQNVIAMLAVAGPTRGRIGAGHVAAVLAHGSTGGPPDPPLSLAAARGLSDRRVVASSLARHAGQCAAAARELGVSRQGLAKLMARLQLSKGA